MRFAILFRPPTEIPRIHATASRVSPRSTNASRLKANSRSLRMFLLKFMAGFALGDGQWDIPKLRVLLDKIIPEHGVMEDYEVEHEFPGLGSRTMLLNGRQAFYEGGAETTILLGIEDVTERRILEHQKDELLRQKDILLDEIQHRIANSLQIIAGIILMKAKRVGSEEARVLLQDTHDRVISIATVQQQLNASGIIGSVELVPYLTRLCDALAASM